MKRLKEAVPLGKFRVDAAVFATAAVEYLVAEVLEIAGIMAINVKRKRITPSLILLASK